MAANRKPYCAPDRLLAMSKVSLADALWEIASSSALAQSTRSSENDVWVAIQIALQKVKAPARDRRSAIVAREELEAS